MKEECGPIYNVPLIDSLPLGTGGMRQAMPSRRDLEQVQRISPRTVAGYEVLLASWLELRKAADAAISQEAPK